MDKKPTFLDAQRYVPSAREEVYAQVFMTFGETVERGLGAMEDYDDALNDPEHMRTPLEAAAHVRDVFKNRQDKIHPKQYKRLVTLLKRLPSEEVLGITT